MNCYDGIFRWIGLCAKGPLVLGLPVYREISNISRTKSQTSNVSRLGLQLILRNILKPGVKWSMKM